MQRACVLTETRLQHKWVGRDSNPEPTPNNGAATEEQVEQAAKAIIERSQNKPPIGGFLNVAWGTSREEAKKIISQRDGVVFEGSNQKQSHLYFSGGTFSDFDVQSIALFFLDERFYRGQITVRPKATLNSTWNDLCVGLAKKYGPPDHQDNDSLSALWWFPNEEKANEIIQCFVAQTHEGIAVIYIDVPIDEGAKRAHEEGISTKDF